jgi:uncharacterized membrane protein YjjP (DUF1212 family)
MEDNKEIKELGTILLETGAMLMSTGASTARIRITVNRISEAFGYETDLFISHRALTLNLSNNNKENMFSSLKRTSPHGVNFKVVSAISRMSWSVVEEKWTLEQIRQELTRIKSLKHYPRLVTLSLVGVSGSCFCYFAGGNLIEMLITFIATFIGLFVRQESTKKEFNTYFCIFLGSLTASLVSGLFTKINIGITTEHAFATSVLFLIPGVPLINTFTDLFDGNILNSMVRGVQSLTISFMIALGLFSAYFVYQF